jgi:hypothetical protein
MGLTRCSGTLPYVRAGPGAPVPPDLAEQGYSDSPLVTVRSGTPWAVLWSVAAGAAVGGILIVWWGAVQRGIGHDLARPDDRAQRHRYRTARLGDLPLAPTRAALLAGGQPVWPAWPGHPAIQMASCCGSASCPRTHWRLRGTWSAIPGHAMRYLRVIAATLDVAGRADDRGFGPLLSFELAGEQVAEADAVIAAARLIVPTTSFGGLESSWERRARWPSESAPASVIRGRSASGRTQT